MANAIYPKYKAAALGGGANHDILGGNVKIALIDTADEAYNANDEFLSDVTGAGIVGTSGNLSGKSVTAGVFDFADPTVSAVSGDQFEALIVYVDTGVAGTSRLVAFIDTGWTGLPLTPNGGDVVLAINASGLFAL